MTTQELLFGLFNSCGWPVLSYEQLVYLTEPFGLSPDTLRPALMRMKQKKLMSSGREEGKTRYRLSDRSRRISRNVASPFKDPDWSRWNGMWRGVLFQTGQESQRAALRKKLTAYRLVCLEKGFWIRPYLEEEEMKSGFDQAFLEEDVRLMRFLPDQPNFVNQVKELWQLEELNQEYEALLMELTQEDPIPDEPAQALVQRIELGHRVISQLCRNPQLPEALLPQDWKAGELRVQYFAMDRKLKDIAEPYIRGLQHFGGIS